MKTLFSLIVLLAITLSLRSQNWDLSLSGGSWLNADQSEDFVIEPYYSFDFFDITADSVVRTTNVAMVHGGPIYEKNLQFAAGAGWSGDITGKLGYRLGGELLLGGFEKRNEFQILSLMSTSTEFVASTFNILGSGDEECDAFTNTPQDLGQIDLQDNYTTLHLGLNAALSYAITEQLSLLGELSLRTPLYTRISSEFVTRESRLENGQNICTWVAIQSNDVSGDGFRNAVFGAQAKLYYRVQSDLSLFVGCYQSLNNYFVQPSDRLASQLLFENNFVQSNQNSILPLELKIGVSWSLGTSQPMVENPN